MSTPSLDLPPFLFRHVGDTLYIEQNSLKAFLVLFGATLAILAGIHWLVIPHVPTMPLGLILAFAIILLVFLWGTITYGVLAIKHKHFILWTAGSAGIELPKDSSVGPRSRVLLTWAEIQRVVVPGVLIHDKDEDHSAVVLYTTESPTLNLLDASAQAQFHKKDRLWIRVLVCPQKEKPHLVAHLKTVMPPQVELLTPQTLDLAESL